MTPGPVSSAFAICALTVIDLSIGTSPLSVEAGRIVVIGDPADALDQIAGDTITALRATAGRRR